MREVKTCIALRKREAIRPAIQARIYVHFAIISFLFWSLSLTLVLCTLIPCLHIPFPLEARSVLPTPRARLASLHLPQLSSSAIVPLPVRLLCSHPGSPSPLSNPLAGITATWGGDQGCSMGSCHSLYFLYQAYHDSQATTSQACANPQRGLSTRS